MSVGDADHHAEMVCICAGERFQHFVSAVACEVSLFGVYCSTFFGDGWEHFLSDEPTWLWGKCLSANRSYLIIIIIVLIFVCTLYIRVVH